MIEQIELTSFDLSYEGCRMRHSGIERELCTSIMESGIKDPLEGVDVSRGRILLDGFKRYRCAVKLKIAVVPYISLGNDEAIGVIELIRMSNARSLNAIEEARLIDKLKNEHKMSISEIAEKLSRSKPWVSLRAGIIGEMGENVVNEIMAGRFPMYSYMNSLRQFAGMNYERKKEIEGFVNKVSGKNLSVRDIELLSYGYFKGGDELRGQINEGNIHWVLERLKEPRRKGSNCSDYEQSMLNDLEIVQKYVNRIIHKSGDERLRSRSFKVQANIVAGGIVSKMEIFSKKVRQLYDRTREAESDICVTQRRYR